MKKIYDVTALGELLIDFTENGTSAQGNPLLEANPGGALHLYPVQQQGLYPTFVRSRKSLELHRTNVPFAGCRSTGAEEH